MLSAGSIQEYLKNVHWDVKNQIKQTNYFEALKQTQLCTIMTTSTFKKVCKIISNYFLFPEDAKLRQSDTLLVFTFENSNINIINLRSLTESMVSAIFLV